MDLAGDTESFSWAQNESNVGQRIRARIIQIDVDKVIWMREIIVRSA
ncbi:MAG: hypothetical protein QCI82_05005 [Candidatus Thermoplasmatota archaeon]|nr:hypothetical protein [Candidatus Thermoplasmatota archaeon]